MFSMRVLTRISIMVIAMMVVVACGDGFGNRDAAQDIYDDLEPIPTATPDFPTTVPGETPQVDAVQGESSGGQAIDPEATRVPQPTTQPAVDHPVDPPGVETTPAPEDES